MNCIQGNQHLLQQINQLLSELKAEHYNRPLEAFSGATLGQHFRHLIDFYFCLLNGLEAEELDYSRRDRSECIESDPLAATQAIEDIIERLQPLNERDVLQVRTDLTADPGLNRPLVNSSVGRELMFAHDHAVHHLAIIKMGIGLYFPETVLPAELGLAPSTLKHRKLKSIPQT